MKVLVAVVLLVGCQAPASPPTAMIEVEAGAAPPPTAVASDAVDAPPTANDAHDAHEKKEVPGPKGLATISGTTSKPPIANAERVVAGLRPRFRACYQQGLQSDPTLAGTATIDLTVDKNGEVTSAKTTPSSSTLDSVAACTTRTARNATFDPPPSASKVSFKVTFALAP